MSYKDVKQTQIQVNVNVAKELGVLADEMGERVERPVYNGEIVRELIRFYRQHENAVGVLGQDMIRGLQNTFRSAENVEPVETLPDALSVTVSDEMTVKKYMPVEVRKYMPVKEPAHESQERTLKPADTNAPPKRWVPGARLGSPLRTEK